MNTGRRGSPVHRENVPNFHTRRAARSITIFTILILVAVMVMVMVTVRISISVTIHFLLLVLLHYVEEELTHPTEARVRLV